ncbi:MAG: hypothetical protein VW146_05545 [Gammaproteobacteria bacterium]
MDNKEKLSAFYDNELLEDAQGLIKAINDQEQLASDLRGYSLISSIMAQSRISESSKRSFKIFKSSFISHSFAAAAAVLVTLGFVTYFNPAQFDLDKESSKLLADAIASDEGQIRLNQEENLLVDHLFHIMDEKNLTSDMNPGWIPVGFSQNKERPAIFTNGTRRFVLHVENSELSLTKPMYWKNGNNLVYLYPTADGKTITVYGNIRPVDAEKIIFSLKR